ncbi:hypothetical protein NPIL_470351 [Nephila pilipes]|uniref:DDE-1 domain-containing protein n=1 Tax=Nephila pilipes TaxID=299642 RepID=A0A8X6NFR4_NEPPI|nr:hypothetical protein NPIL_470351 [Nephila pilipes]
MFIIVVVNRNYPRQLSFILEKCLGHPDEKDLNSKGSFIYVMFLSSKTIPLWQSTNDNNIHAFKMQYKTRILSMVLSQDYSVIQPLKELNLIDMIHSFSNAWVKLSRKRDCLIVEKIVAFQENNHFLMTSDITEIAISPEVDEERNGGEVMTADQIIPHNTITDSFATSIT